MVTAPDNFITSLSLFVLSTNQKLLKLGLLYINNLCSLEHGELEHRLNNCYNSVLASPFLHGAAPALVRVTPCPFSLFAAAPCPL